MVTQAELRLASIRRQKQQIGARRVALEAREKEYVTERQRLEQLPTEVRVPRTQMELRKATPQTQVQFREEVRRLEAQRVAAKVEAVKELREQEAAFKEQAQAERSALGEQYTALGQYGEKIKALQRSEYGMSAGQVQQLEAQRLQPLIQPSKIEAEKGKLILKGEEIGQEAGKLYEAQPEKITRWEAIKGAGESFIAQFKGKIPVLSSLKQKYPSLFTGLEEQGREMKLPAFATKPFEYGATPILWAGMKIRDIGAGILGKEPLTKEEKAVTKEAGMPIVTSVLKFGFFAPYMKTAMAQKAKGKVVAKTTEKRDITPYLRHFEEIGKKSKSDLLRELKLIQNKIKTLDNPAAKQYWKQVLDALAERLYQSKMISDATFKSITGQEVVSLAKEGKKVGGLVVDIVGVYPKELKHLPEIESLFVFRLPKDKKKVKELEEKAADKPYIRHFGGGATALGVMGGARAEEMQLPTAAIGTSVLAKEGLSLFEAQQARLKALEQTKQVPVTQTGLRSGLLSKQAVLQKQVLRQKLMQQQVQRAALKTRLKTKLKPRFKIPLWFPRGAGKEDKLARLRRLKQAYELQIRKAGKWYQAGTGMPYGMAMKKGQELVKRTLRASFRLKKKGVTEREDIPTRVSRIFRPAKREKGVWVEKRKFRLDFPQEKLEILKARRKK